MSIYPFNVAGTRIPTWLDLLLLASIFLLLRYFHSFWHVSSKGKPKLPLPPGPKGLPILGMTLQVLAPRKQYATLFEGWHQAYARESSMMSFPTLRRKHIVINDPKVAHALLGTRGATHAERPDIYYQDQLQGGGLNLVAMKGGEKVERIRKLYHEQMSPKAAGQWLELQRTHAYWLTSQLIEATKAGKEVTDTIESAQKRLTMRMFCGDLPASMLAQGLETEAFLDTLPQPPVAPLLDIFPILRSIPAWCPGGGYKKGARRYLETNTKLWNTYRDEVKRQASLSEGPECIWGNLYKTNAFERHGFTDAEASHIIGNSLGSNFVPAIALQIFVIAMLHFPDVLSKAQAEVDAVVGRARLPAFSDESSLPYTRALVSELFRWRPIGPLVNPHIASQDDTYDGMHVPPGASLWVNLQAISRNETIYPEPEQFRPERFLAEDDSFTRKDELAVFGYGKRRCPGDQLALKIVWMGVVTMLWAVDIELPEGEKLPSIDVEEWYTAFGLVFPKPFKAVFTPRGANVESLLREGGKEWFG